MGHSLICASVVALSVGLAVWTCSMIYSQLLKPLGFPGSDRWYSVQSSSRGTSVPRPAVDAYTYQELLAENRSADYLGAFAHRSVVLSEEQASTQLRGADITPRLHPTQMSGGQQQRVAIARALVGRPKVLLADEPTGSLDSTNAQLVMDMLDELHSQGSTIVMVTHDPRFAERAERVVSLFDGRIIDDRRQRSSSAATVA